MSDFINLADLAGIDTTGVAEVRLNEKLPEGLYTFEIVEPKIEDETVEEDGEKIQKLKASFPLIVRNVAKIIDPVYASDQTKLESLVGKRHNHMVVRKLKGTADEKNKILLDFVGMIKAFLVDVQLPGNGKINELMTSSNGHKFEAPIVYGKNRDDPSNPYVNIKLDKAKAVAA